MRLPRERSHLRLLEGSYATSASSLRRRCKKGGTEAQPLVEALEILRELNAIGAGNVADGAPTLFVPNRWQGYLDEAAPRGTRPPTGTTWSCARCSTTCARGTSSCPPGRTLVLTEARIEGPVTFEEETGTSRRLHPFQRPKFGELLAYARPGGIVHISEMFRLVRSTRHLLDVLDVLRQGRLPRVAATARSPPWTSPPTTHAPENRCPP